MSVVLAILGVIFVLAVAAIAVWLWLFIDIDDQVAELIRIRVEEQIALWRLAAIGRIARLEQRYVRNRQNSRTSNDS